MAAKKTCPSCKKEINANAKKCPECQKDLEILYWDIELESGDKALYPGEGAEPSIREQLVSGKLKLSNRCRQYINVLEGVEDGQEHYGLKKEMEWKTLRNYADGVFSLQALYNPFKAYGKRVAKITWAVIGAIVAIGWNMDILLTAGANPLIALVISVVLLLLTPTVVGLGIASFVVGSTYRFPPFSMAFRTLIAIIIAGLIGGAVGWTLGYLIGALVGFTKKKMLEA